LLSFVYQSSEKRKKGAMMEQKKNIELCCGGSAPPSEPQGSRVEQDQAAFSARSASAPKFRRVKRNCPLIRAEAC
jgi:hypothetical protein